MVRVGACPINRIAVSHFLCGYLQVLRPTSCTLSIRQLLRLRVRCDLFIAPHIHVLLKKCSHRRVAKTMVVGDNVYEMTEEKPPDTYAAPATLNGGW